MTARNKKLSTQPKSEKKIKITTEEAKTPPPPNTTEMELLPFPESSMTIIFENNTPPILETNTPLSERQRPEILERLQTLTRAGEEKSGQSERIYESAQRQF